MDERKELEVVVILNLVRNNRYTGELEVLLQKRRDTDSFGGWWTPACMGHYADYDRAIEQAMIREAKEELGITIAKGDLKAAIVREMPGEYCENALHVFYNLSGSLSEEPILCEPVLCEELRWIPYEDAMEKLWRQSPLLVSMMKTMIHHKLCLNMKNALQQLVESRKTVQ